MQHRKSRSSSLALKGNIDSRQPVQDHPLYSWRILPNSELEKGVHLKCIFRLQMSQDIEVTFPLTILDQLNIWYL